MILSSWRLDLVVERGNGLLEVERLEHGRFSDLRVLVKDRVHVLKETRLQYLREPSPERRPAKSGVLTRLHASSIPRL